MRSDASEQLLDGVVRGRGDASRLEDLPAHVRVGDTEQELLLLSALGRREARRQEVFQDGRDSGLRDGHDVLERLLGRLEGVARRELDHLREPLQAEDGLLDLRQLSAGLIELLLLEEGVAGGGLVKDKQLGHSGLIYQKILFLK